MKSATKKPKIDPEVLKLLRERIRLTGAEFAEKLRVDRATVWRWEQGKSQPSEIHRHQMRQLWGFRFEFTKRENK